MNYNYHLMLTEKAVVSSTSYVSPLQELLDLSRQLKIENYRGEVIFDLLCVNGNNPNRFISIFFNGDAFDKSSVKLIEHPGKKIIEIQTKFYKEHPQYISNSILSSRDRVFFAHQQ
jgi:hypothetical protein